ncbi:MAG TPA: DUF4833 domain-containing protein [Cyclobacteriaceae bacterium]|nr:DUF4833 domain-containing protein [Cyclobacteriaceae bacterium]HRJ81130.1 DUF4833 domain-containing protein [Cyclobacteriaceae bacterium]
MRLFTLLPLVLLVLPDSPGPIHEFPVPPLTHKTLFYIHRSVNSNTVLYEVNLLNNTTIDPKNPVTVYWIRYAEKGQKRDLNMLERNFAYGIKCIPLQNGKYTLQFVASKARQAEILLDRNGQATAIMDINGKPSRLKKIFVHVAEDGWWPKVDYVEFFGEDVSTKEVTYEKMKV